MMNGDDIWLLKLSMMSGDHLWWLMHLYNEIKTKLRMVSVHHISSYQQYQYVYLIWPLQGSAQSTLDTFEATDVLWGWVKTIVTYDYQIWGNRW
jgi:hypothetical protein